MKLSEQWTNQSEKILHKLTTLTQEQDRDRLEIINALILALNAIDRSVQGWRKWIQNLDFMARFSEDELKAIEQGLLKSVRSFIEYDIDITKRHENKIPQIRVSSSHSDQNEDPRGLYA